MNTFRQYIPKPVKHVLKPLYLRTLPAPIRFIVLTRGRTGSNLLISLLGTHPDALMYNEVFSQQLLEDQAYRDQLNRSGAARYLQNCFQRHDREKAVGAKILYYQIENDYAERYHVPTLPEVAKYLHDDKHLRVIHLKRRNRLRTVVSWELARATNRWARHNDEETMNDEVHISISPANCEQEFLTLEAWETKYDRLFKEHPVFSIDYEDLVSDLAAKTKEILGFLDLPQTTLIPGTKKQTSKPITEVISNYSELQEYFQGTRWSEYFI